MSGCGTGAAIILALTIALVGFAFRHQYCAEYFPKEMVGCLMR